MLFDYRRKYNMDMLASTCGYFGKLPLRGDFIQRNLDQTFVTLWDQWLQSVISTSRTTLDEQWLDNYLISPVWRYFIKLDDKSSYAGIMLPSIDKVGRYFPFTIAIALSKDEDSMQFIEKNKTWYDQAETIALQALAEQIDFVQLNQAVDNLTLIETIDHAKAFEETSKAYRIDLSNNYTLEMGLSRLQAKLCMPLQQSSSFWWNQNTEQADGNLLCCTGLPDDNIFVAMLDGQWDLCHVNRLDGLQLNNE